MTTILLIGFVLTALGARRAEENGFSVPASRFDSATHCCAIPANAEIHNRTWSSLRESPSVMSVTTGDTADGSPEFAGTAMRGFDAE